MNQYEAVGANGKFYFPLIDGPGNILKNNYSKQIKILNTYSVLCYLIYNQKIKT